ncbi:hypothetical protein ACFFRR_006555 [Megaselia abdita]
MEVLKYIFYPTVFIASLVYYMFRRRLSYWKDRGIPHDRPHFIYGNMIGIQKEKNFHELLRDYYMKYKHSKPFVGFFMMASPDAMILDLDLIKSILIKDFHNFNDRYHFFNERDDPISAHLFAVDGKRWKIMRHKLTPTYTSGKMKFMFPTIVEVGCRFNKTFMNIVENGGTIVEIKDLMARFTTDVIGTCAFGIECNSLENPDVEFRTYGRKIFTSRSPMKETFLRSFPRLARTLRMRKFPKDMAAFFTKIVRDTIDYREKNGIERNDFMNLLIELKNKDNSLTIDEIVAETFIFFVAGFDTSSAALGYCMYELAHHPEIQRNVRKEIESALEKYDGELNYEANIEMTFLDQVIKETIRKYTVFPFLTRVTEEDYKIPNSNLVIEKGVKVIIPIDALNNDPDLFPDPDKFDPSRFSADEIKKRHPMAWLPFGEGPRNCIGLRFAMMQIRIGLISILKDFEFSTCDRTETPIINNPRSFILAPFNGIFLKVERIVQ